jgi:small subunit ribosomal protein S29
MKLKSIGLLAGSCFQTVQRRLSSTSPNAAVISNAPFFKTTETNPANLTKAHLGRFYTIEPEVMKFLFGGEKNFGLSPEFNEQCQTFNETSILVRKPFLDIKQCIETYDSSLPTLRYVLYGVPGGGKSITLVQLVHYAHVQDYVIVDVPYMPFFSRFITDTVPSSLRQDYVDHTARAVSWLQYFKLQNASRLKKLQLTTDKDYVWSKREITPKGSTIEEIVEHGLARPVFASESVYALIEQLKTSSSAKKCKTMVIINGANVLYNSTWRIRRPDRTEVPFDKLTLFEAFRQACKSDWSGGVVVASVDKKAVPVNHRESDMPRYLLTKTGWEEFDPFVPVLVDVYSSQEVQTTIDYYLERKWLMHPLAGTEKARKELEFLSTRNPETLMQLCNSR